MGLTPPQGRESTYYISLYRVLYLLCVAIAAWRFGIKSGAISSLILAVIVLLPSMLGLRTASIILDIRTILLGLVVSWVLGRQGTLQRLLFKSTFELKEQAAQLKMEIAELEKDEKEIRVLSVDAIESLVFALEAKDRYTAGHSRRVTGIAAAIGEKMNLSQEEMDDLRFGSLLNDLGKIAVDQMIQNKPSPLTKEEYEHIMIHVQAGADIVKPIVNTKVVGLIEHHHDRFSGGSRAQLVMGENIPLGARIIALADAFDAMTSDRPYRTAMSAQEAIREVQSHTGTQFKGVRTTPNS
jgi:HD-GYP domain-containing protein (c-di-GMP phosphodiesterase class II)